MSVSYEVKKTIIDNQYKNACCRRALLNGVLAAKAYLGKDNNIYVSLDKQEQVSFVASLIKEFYGKEITVAVAQKGGRGKKIFFDSKSAKKYILLLDASNTLFLNKCQACTSSFLRGVFLACGRFSDPEKQFCLEFSLGNRASLFLNAFKDLGFEMKNVMRLTENILYTKNSIVIEDFFATAELNETAYMIMNIKIRNEFLNEANRIRNFDTVNISKTVDAATPQLAVIEKLNEHKLLEMLPEELIGTAKLRLAYPDFSLSQLARLSVPPITKSGITHRMSKIVKLGKEILAKYNLYL